jgi:DNA-directed RNA polymerase specialized sigma24 family protein
MAEGYYEGLWDEVEDTDEDLETEVSEPLKRVGHDTHPVYDRPRGMSRAQRYKFTQLWGRGEPVVTPRLREHLEPGELELYTGALSRKLTHYAWSRVQAYGSALIDAESLVQEALITRWQDPTPLEPRDIERFAIMLIKSRSINMTRELDHRGSGPEDETDPQFFSRGRMRDADHNPYRASDIEASTLRPESWTWIQYHLSKKAAEAVRLVLEEGYTQDEAARKVGLRRLAVIRAFNKLKDEASEQEKDTF